MHKVAYPSAIWHRLEILLYIACPCAEKFAEVVEEEVEAPKTFEEKLAKAEKEILRRYETKEYALLSSIVPEWWYNNKEI